MPSRANPSAISINWERPEGPEPPTITMPGCRPAPEGMIRLPLSETSPLSKLSSNSRMSAPAHAVDAPSTKQANISIDRFISTNLYGSIGVYPYKKPAYEASEVS